MHVTVTGLSLLVISIELPVLTDIIVKLSYMMRIDG